MAIQIQIRNGTAAQWVSANSLLATGEMGVETDTNKFKIGTGLLTWNNLPYATASFSITSSYALNSSAGATYTSSLYGTASWATNVVNGSTYNMTSSIYGTSSWAISASYAVNGGGSSGVTISSASFSATTSFNASTANAFRITLTGSLLLNTASNSTDGQRLVYQFRQDGVGSRTLTLGTGFATGSDIVNTVLTTTPSLCDFMTTITDTTTQKQYIVGLVHGYL